MRCLHCGSTLSTFKKLTDSDFCSAEHRDVFYTEQQKLILERLRASATRFHKLRRGNTADTVVAPPKVEEAQAPAKLAAFLYAKLEAQQRLFGLRYFLAEGISIAVPIYPRRESSRSVNTGLFASFIPDLPWPRYNPGSHHLIDFTPAEITGDVEFGSIFDLRGTLYGGIGSHGLAPTLAPEVANIVFKRPFSLRMAKPKASVALGPVRLARFGSGIFKLAGTGYRDFVELAAIDAIQNRLFAIDPNPIEANGDIEISSSLRLRLRPGAREVAFLDRVYKMRPKTGVLSSDVPSMRSVPLDQFAGAAELVRPMAHGTGSAGEFRLSAPARPLLMAGQAVQSEQYEIASAFPAVGFEGTPALPETRVAQDFAPGSLDRFFRQRPRGPVADDGLSTMQTLASEPNGFVSQVANPSVLRNSKYPVLQQHGDLIARSFDGPTADPPNAPASGTPPTSSYRESSLVQPVRLLAATDHIELRAGSLRPYAPNAAAVRRDERQYRGPQSLHGAGAIAFSTSDSANCRSRRLCAIASDANVPDATESRS